MLTIQPKILNSYRPAFSSDMEVADKYDEFNLSEMSEDEYKSSRHDLESARKELEQIIDENNLPKPVNKILKFTKVFTAALLGGMATGFGASQTVKGFKKLSKLKAVNSFNNSVKSAFKFTGKQVKHLFNNKYTKNFFDENKFGIKLKSIFTSVKNSKFVTKIHEAVEVLLDKVKGVKPETYKKVLVNTVGVSGGIASGVNTIREEAKAGAEE